ncbi:MAG: FtsX-like permease family protein [Akkermansiaceae bacterium]|nr:FtsX-like permease family protein [Akkermansiaceae bacterium]
MLPFSYAIRNLLRSKTRLMQTIGGSALVVLLVMSAVAINQGMNRVLSASGSERNVILLGAGSEESTQRSEVKETTATIASSSIPGITEQLGVRAVSGEIHYMTYLGFPDDSRAQALIRGVTPAILHVHPEVRIVEGSFPRSGEVMAGVLAWRNLGVEQDQLKVGSTVRIDNQEMTVSGLFSAPGTVMESEVWATVGDIRVLAQRETLSCVVVRLDDPADFSEADLFAKQRLDLELSALRESDYYGRLSDFFGPLRAMIWVTVSLIAAGAVFGGINTLYAAFASRVREMATLQAIGFGRTTLAFSLIQESTLACLSGSLVASIIAMIAMDGLQVPFSIGTFSLEVTGNVALTGILTGLLLGIVGAIPPAIRCLKPSLPVALRS